MLNILVVEDAFTEMEYLCALVKQMVKDCHIFKVGDAKGAIRLMGEQEIDVFFLDVALPDLSGWKLAEEIRKHRQYQLTEIIFVTGQEADDPKIQRRFHHYDFIEKPYTPKIFREAVGVLLKELDRRKSASEAGKKEVCKVIYIETDEYVTNVSLDSIYFVESLGRGIRLHTKTNQYTIAKVKLEEFIGNTNSKYFIRCHKSFGLYVKNIKLIESADRRLWNAYFDREKKVHCLISQTYYDGITALLKALSEEERR